MKTRIALIVLVLASCEAVLEPLPDGRPDVFEFNTAGFAVSSNAWTLHGDTVVYQIVSPDSPPKITVKRCVPSLDNWTQFWASLDQAGVRRWKQEYVAEGIVDGGGWYLKISSGTFNLTSQGSNKYPDRNGEGHLETTSEFQTVRSAFQELAANHCQ